MTQSTSSPSSSSPLTSSSSLLPRGVPPFLHHLLTVSTVQICREAGFTRSHSSALDSLTSLLHLYIRELGEASKAYAELSNRQHVNLLDILSALDDYQHGVDLLIDYRQHSDPLPFYHPVPPFPFPRPLLKVQPSSLLGPRVTLQFTALNPHVPPFLPRFPDERLYVATPVKPDPVQGDVRKRKLEQTRAVEDSLTRLTALQRQRQRDDAADDDGKRHKRAPSTADVDPLDQPSSPSSHVPVVAPSATVSGARERERERALGKNPFLAPPLPPAPPVPAAPTPAPASAGAAAMTDGGAPSPMRAGNGGGGSEGGRVGIGTEGHSVNVSASSSSGKSGSAGVEVKKEVRYTDDDIDI